MTTQPLRPVWRYIGFWCAMIMAIAQATSAARAFANPAGFADYMGLPLADVGMTSFVTVYALRTSLIAFLAAFLALTRRFGALAAIAAVALLLPLGDAWLAAEAGAAQSVVARHLAIALFLGFTALMLRRDASAGDPR